MKEEVFLAAFKIVCRYDAMPEKHFIENRKVREVLIIQMSS